MSSNQNTPAPQNQGASKRRLVVKRKQGQNTRSNTSSAPLPHPSQFASHQVPMMPMAGHMPGHQIPMGIPGHQVPMMPMVPNFQHQARPQVRSHRVYVDDEDVGFVIGGGGSTVKRIKSQTGALIKHFKNDPEDSEHNSGYFNLRGNDHQIHCAKISIQELVIESKRRRIASLLQQVEGVGGGYGSNSPGYAPRSPDYAPRSPDYTPHSPQHRPTTPPAPNTK